MMRKKGNELKRGDCFQFTKNGPIYQKDFCGDAQCIAGRQIGTVIYTIYDRKVYPIKVKIVEEK